MKKGIILLGLFGLLFSCNDATDITQAGELNDQRLFTNVANMQLFLNETYDKLATETDIVTSSKLSDEIAIGSGLTVDDTQRFFVTTTNTEARTIWGTHYGLINYCNRVIRGATYFTPPAADVPAYNSILAQARALRAFAHFELMVYFSKDLSDDNGLGVMLVDHVPTISEDIPRSTNGALFNFIESDLSYAESNLIAPSGANAYKYVSQNFINALRARMYLYRKNYTQALTYANAVIGARPLATSLVPFTGATALYPANSAVIPPVGSGTGSTTINVSPSTAPAQAIQRALYQVDQWTSTAAPTYRKMWVDADQGEILFAIDRQNNRTNWGSQYNTNGSYLTGGPLFDMDHNLFSLYTQTMGGGAEDFRRWCFVDRSSTILADHTLATRTNEQIVIDKYPGKTGAHTANDIKVFRESEIYFIKAECLVRSGDLPGAANLIQQVRQARNYVVGGTVPTPVYANATAALADILTERRKELAFEGHRYIDLKRLGADAGVTGTDRDLIDAANSSATSPANILLGDYRFTLPIPQDEININPLPQNDGYVN
ncbi:MAG TPA: RagB/SusD family nutrient uptake outer membrane protein [Flavobacterium sp.]|uniref:RagB/SusD family nutrient uptake outer membrane protein n=1 Tax=Flavobacterium sp. TaxID=239 RepID=UPI002C0DC8BB|nr:RagB/SusD family nutrient uptake outer membrane protein [Flavobacterium sp.]HNP32219.1 RagB/SusD family nutrient uptake outer membrane protein [Flavobacterium sp.]